MAPRDWLLLLLDGGLDPIRIQKGMFLFSMEGDSPTREQYKFEPYNWGPLSKRIYFDLEELLADGLVERVPVPGETYARYRRTDAGTNVAEAIAQKADQARTSLLETIREKVTSLSFERLLEDVYDRYPEYATKSLFNQPVR